MECSPGTKRITEKQVLKARDTLIWKREERARLRLMRSPAAKRLSLQHSQGGVKLQNGTSGDIQVQGPGQGALGLALLVALSTAVSSRHSWNKSTLGSDPTGVPPYMGEHAARPWPLPLLWGESSPSRQKRQPWTKVYVLHLHDSASLGFVGKRLSKWWNIHSTTKFF